MLAPSAIPWKAEETLATHLERRGVSRRDFVGWCTRMGLLLGVSASALPRVAQAMAAIRRPTVIWLQLQECTGCVESVTRTADPTIGDLVLDVVSLDYQHTLMAAAGDAAEQAKRISMSANAGKYLLIVTGSIPLNEDGIYTTIGGRTAREVLVEAAAGAAAVIAVGACAHFGGVQAAKPNPTGAVAVRDLLVNKPVVNIAGCPPIGDVITGTVVHFLTFGSLPDLDREGRPLFAYGARIHDQCPRRANFDAGQFVKTFDDDAARQGWCLYEVGCKGPETFSPCPIIQWNGHVNFPIGAGHPCIGCTEPFFWDTMSPFYTRLPQVAGVSVERTADVVGLSLAAGAAAGVLAHAAATQLYKIRTRRAETGGVSPPPGYSPVGPPSGSPVGSPPGSSPGGPNRG